MIVPTVHLTVYHNQESRFCPYADGHRLNAVTSHALTAEPGVDIDETVRNVAAWAWRTFNADIDMLEANRDTATGETAFIAACVYRLLGHRSLSVGDVLHLQVAYDHVWLACDPYGWRPITEPTNRTGTPLTAQRVYERITQMRTGGNR